MMRTLDLRRTSRASIMRGIALAALFGARFGPTSPANAQTFSSSYTSTARKNGRLFTSAGNGIDDPTIRLCPGKAGPVVVISEDDDSLRETVSVGRNRAAAARELAAAEPGFGPFNSTTNTVEWRAPTASRLRSSSAGTSLTMPTRMQVPAVPLPSHCWRVTRLPPGAVCHVAYIDVKANPKRQ